MPGYRQSYVSDFTGTAIPDGWDVYTGTPGGDPGSQWALNHVTVADGLLQLNTFQDPNFGGEWVTGGLCQCGVAQTYGAYFVRSRVTGAGPTMVELLWPVTGWPPEIDFSETNGEIGSSLATLHFTSANSQIQNTVNVDIAQWHTWGVIWTPTSVIYTVDGRVWGQVNIPADIPNQPMTLDLQQQTWCDATPIVACPTSPQSMLVDWVAEYTTRGNGTVATSSTKTFTVRPFARDSASLTSGLEDQIKTLASQIKAKGDSKVILTGYGDSSSDTVSSRVINRARALAVDRYLSQTLVNMDVVGVQLSLSEASSQTPSTSGARSSAGASSGKVVARILSHGFEMPQLFRGVLRNPVNQH
jgi:outer membrane protein OmpA-like peptidoglycan-associated protein